MQTTNMQFIRNVKVLVVLLLMTSAMLTSCRRTDNPADANEQEKITTVKLKLTPTTGGAPVEATWRDLDGPGGNPPQITPLNLRAGLTYNGEIEFKDESKNPPEDKTEEIEAEDDEHLISYIVGGNATGRLTITRTDRDKNGLEVGLKYRATVSAGPAASGTLRVVLYHYTAPARKTAALAPSNEIDIDATFPVSIAP
jgi:hypothetical protein